MQPIFEFFLHITPWQLFSCSIALFCAELMLPNFLWRVLAMGALLTSLISLAGTSPIINLCLVPTLGGIIYWQWIKYKRSLIN